MWQITKNFFRVILVGVIALSLFLSGFPSSFLVEKIVEYRQDKNIVDALYHALKDPNVIDKGLGNVIKPQVQKAKGATFNMQTGYYMGNGGAGQSITGLGFKPDMILLKPNTNAGIGAIMKTSAMPAINSAVMGAATADTASIITLGGDGFTVAGANANTANIGHSWMAFGGSDCTVSGTFCVGSFTGTGTATRTVDTGFRPDLIIVKRSTAVAANWSSSVMADNHAQFFSATTNDTTGVYFTTTTATGFTVGATNNVSTGVYHFVAFKEVAGAMDVGTYTGNAADNRSITGVGFQPDGLLLKNANAGTAVTAAFSINESYGDNSSLFTDTANLVNAIQALQADGFQVGSHSVSNGNGNAIYYAAFGGAPDPSSSGTFEMSNGSYVGTGQYLTISGLDFVPDLVIVKASGTVAGVFRTRMMNGDTTAYLDAATANFAGGITDLRPDGFTVYTNAAVNTAGVTYHWQAFGNAWDPMTNSGASDFFIGAYYGNGIDNRDITRLPFQPDMVSIKRSGATAGTFRTAILAGDLSSFYAATAEAANNIQALNTDGFEVGTAANVNTAANIYWYFGFKEGTNFDVGGYTGNGADNTDITTPGFDPDLVWIKRSTAVSGVMRPTTLPGDLTQFFITTAQAAGRIKSFVTNGFRLGTQSEVNANGGTYRYVAWDNTSDYVADSPTFNMQTGYYMGNGGTAQSITGLGFKPEMILLKPNTTAGAGAILKTTAMPVANSAFLGSATVDAASMIGLDANGFTVGGANANTANIGHSWIAFGGSNCSTTGTFCVGSYTGNGAGARALSIGFRPDLVMIKQTAAVAANWSSSVMADNHAQFFMATTNETTGALYTTTTATGFTVGATNNTNAVVYHFVAFKESAGAIDVGTYTGNAADSRSITGVGFQPDALFLKNANAGTPVSGAFSINESYGDNSHLFTDTANSTNVIQALEADGFQVGTNSISNGNANAVYYAAFGGAASHSSSGNFQMESGTYTGTGQYNIISGLSFAPDLVIVKVSGTTAGVFRTRMMNGDSTAFLDSASANVAGAITDLRSDGFTVYTHASVNTLGNTYHWQAFGNAWDPMSNSGASDFFIGAYYGNGIDSRDITGIPFQPDMVSIKLNGTTGGTIRTATMAGDLSSFYAATAEAANNVQALNADGFEVGTAANVNTAASTYWTFGFKEGTSFDVGGYTGNGADNTDITSPGFDPSLVWVKRSTAVAGVMRPSTLTGDLSQFFITTAQAAGRIKSLITNGFRLGTQSEVNANAGTYRYVAWGNASTQPVLTQSAYRFFQNSDATNVGATSTVAQDTTSTLSAAGDAFRLRTLMSVDSAVLTQGSMDFKLQYVDKGSGTCAAPVGGTPETYVHVELATSIAYNNNPTPADGVALTANANDPTVGGRTIVNQTYEESNNYTNSQASILGGQAGKWDFALIDNGAAANTTFCFRMTQFDGTELDAYSVYPEITTAAGDVEQEQSLTFSISNNTVGFGTLSASSPRYASSTLSGSLSDTSDAHTMSASTNASGGYVILLSGNTLTCSSCGGETIDAIGSTATTSIIGTEQFGLRLIKNSGTGTTTAPYDSANWAFDSAAFPDLVATGAGDEVSTVFGVRYLSNISADTDAGEYSSVLTYTVTATF